MARCVYLCVFGVWVLVVGFCVSQGVHAKPWEDPGGDHSFEFRIKSALQSSKAYLVIAGGYGSCYYEATETGSFSKFKTLMDELKNHNTEINYLAICHDHVNRELLANFSHEPGVTRRLELKQTTALLLKYTEDVPENKVHFIGHSWGGWVSMQLANMIADERSIGGFVSVDPISKELCTMRTFLLIFTGFSGSTDCQKSPRDISATKIGRILEVSSFWYNYYQKASRVLHSSSIRGVDKNVMVPYEPRWPDLGKAHRLIDSDERVWEDFTPDLIAAF